MLNQAAKNSGLQSAQKLSPNLSNMSMGGSKNYKPSLQMNRNFSVSKVLLDEIIDHKEITKNILQLN